VAAQSARSNPFHGSDLTQSHRRRRWPWIGSLSRYDELMEAHARIELAVLAALLHSQAEPAIDVRPASQPFAEIDDPSHEGQGKSL
jgi:hypothetical protein